ncbi:MAG: response regulator [Planctomycetes bacterium]|nr:response regulator [Planctomycetota bacterium]
MIDPHADAQMMDELLRKERHLRILHDFAVSLLEARTVEEVLWQVSSGVIARLGFEDFVIYLLDEERQILVQRAAHGAKNPRTNLILERFELPLGEGLVGHVAETGRGLIVPDTSKEPLYLVDDKPRKSEIALPIIHDGKVLGVMDSESSELNFFTQDDFELLQTLASMVAARIVLDRVRAGGESRLRKAYLAAEEAGRAKSRFLANVSHEVRTPLVAVLGLTDMVKSLTESGAPKDVVLDHLGIIGKSGQHLLSLLDQILDLSSDEHGELKLDLRPTNPLKVLREVVDLFRHRASEQGLNLKAFAGDELPEVLLTDPTRLRQILVNLIDNAIKFTEEGGIRVELSRRENSLIFSVADTGVGVAPDELKRIFRSFHQTDSSTTRRHGGVGLGLAISQRLAQRLGGDLTMSSIVGEGSEFVLELPIRVQKDESDSNNSDDDFKDDVAAAERRALFAAKPVVAKRLLLAEDNLASLKLIAFRLRDAGHEVICTENGREALYEHAQAAETGAEFDAVLLDMQMPEVDGFAVARRLRSLNYTRPIVALTAHALPGDRDACFEAGCSHYLAKPFDWDELIHLVAESE